MKRFATYRQWQEKSISKVLVGSNGEPAAWEFSCETCGDSSMYEVESDALEGLVAHNCHF